MATVSFNSVQDWYSLPLRTVALNYSGETPTDVIEFYEIDTSSTFELTPILASNKTNTGTSRVVGYKVSANIVIAQNQIADMSDEIALIESREPSSIVFTFGTASQYGSNISTILVSLGIAGSSNDTTNTLQYGFNAYSQIGLRDTTDIQYSFTIEGVMSKDAITTTARQPFEGV